MKDKLNYENGVLPSIQRYHYRINYRAGEVCRTCVLGIKKVCIYNISRTHRLEEQQPKRKMDQSFEPYKRSVWAADKPEKQG